jgi:hypothetical protein
VVQVVEDLSSKYKAPHSNPTTEKERKGRKGKKMGKQGRKERGWEGRRKGMQK